LALPSAWVEAVPDDEVPEDEVPDDEVPEDEVPDELVPGNFGCGKPGKCNMGGGCGVLLQEGGAGVVPDDEVPDDEVPDEVPGNVIVGK